LGEPRRVYVALPSREVIEDRPKLEAWAREFLRMVVEASSADDPPVS
jgi:hypothetical protein